MTGSEHSFEPKSKTHDVCLTPRLLNVLLFEKSCICKNVRMYTYIEDRCNDDRFRTLIRNCICLGKMIKSYMI